MKPALTSQKMRGGYYTPKPVADFIVRWGLKNGASSVLEPSCGDGAFLRALTAMGKQSGVVAVELDSKEARKAEDSSGCLVVNDDFFHYFANDGQNDSFDLVVGNPPFIRYQNFDKACRERAFAEMKALGLHPNKLTNIWVPFLILSSSRLSENGRLGMVIPAELLQVNYAKECREFLSTFFGKITVVTFKSLLFEGAQQEVVLLLAERIPGSKVASIHFVEMESADSLNTFSPDDIQRDCFSPMDEKLKWTRYFLSPKQRQLLSEISSAEGVLLTTELFDTNVGLVSGENSFFLLTEKDVNERNLDGSVLKIVSRSDQLRGIVFREEDFRRNSEAGKSVYMFDVREDQLELSDAQKAYIKIGEDSEANSNYKCRIRKKWYSVPLSWKPTGYAIRQAGRYPRILVNETDATSTDTVHKIRFHKEVDPYVVAAAFLNSYTLALSETLGRSYGGGVLTFEPSEIRSLRIPMKGADRIDAQFVDNLVRKGDIGAVLDYTDQILLKEELGMDDESISELRSAWESLSNRRMSRRKSGSGSK